MSDRSVYTARRVANAETSAWLPDHAVLVEAGRITGVVPARELPRDAAGTHRVHDLGDVSLLPGLVDVHSHLHCSATPDAYHLVTTESHDRLLLRAAANLRAVLLSGVTTLRDLGSRNEIAFPLRDAVRAGVIPGPRLLLAGTPITTTAGHCHMFGTEADTLDQVVVAVRRQKKLGADCIKVMATGGMFTPTANPRTVQYPVETLTAAVREAGRLGMPVAAHTLSTAGIRNCVEARVDHLIHARWYSADAGKGLEYDADLARRIADQGQWVDVTFGLLILGREAGGGRRAAPHAALVGRRDAGLGRGAPGDRARHAPARRPLLHGAGHGHGPLPLRRVVRQRAGVREMARLLALGGAAGLDRRLRGIPRARPRGGRHPPGARGRPDVGGRRPGRGHRRPRPRDRRDPGRPPVKLGGRVLV